MKCNRVFICTGTREVKPILTELASILSEGAHIIIIAGTIEIKCLESVYDGKISKIVPTMIYEIGEGVNLVCHNSKVLPQDKEFINTIFNNISCVKEIGKPV
jgi:pyrroline-5-carboxylate reductase